MCSGVARIEIFCNACGTGNTLGVFCPTTDTRNRLKTAHQHRNHVQ